MLCCVPGNLAGKFLYPSTGPPSWPLDSAETQGYELWPSCQAWWDCQGELGDGVQQGGAGLRSWCFNPWISCLVGQGPGD